MKHNRVHSSKFIKFRVLQDIPFLWWDVPFHDWTFPSRMGCLLSGQIVPPKLMSTEQPLLVPCPDPQCTCTEGLGVRLSYCMLQTLKMLMFYTYTHTPKLSRNYIHDPDLKGTHAARPASQHWIPIWYLSSKVKLRVLQRWVSPRDYNTHNYLLMLDLYAMYHAIHHVNK